MTMPGQPQMQPPTQAPGEASSELYTVDHETHYAYTAPVSQSWQLAHLTPRQLSWQSVVSHTVSIEPRPDERHDAADSFGNGVTHFGLHTAHRVLRVRMRCEVRVEARPSTGRSTAGEAGHGSGDSGNNANSGNSGNSASGRDSGNGGHGGRVVESVAWEQVRDAVLGRHAPWDVAAAQMCEATRLVPLSEAARLYAAPSFRPGRPWRDAVTDLMHRIHTDFDFEPGATTVSTSVDEVLQQRSGVCQDFAHLMLACLRGHGLAARYMSGYLLTSPPPGMPRLMGADATHAWVAAHAPGEGWVEFDPTNDQLADHRYITLAWGTDFADVVPLRGVILGGGQQDMDVRVTVIPASE